MRDSAAKRLDEIGLQLEELAEGNTALLAEVRRLERGQRELRQELETSIGYAALRDLCLALTGPLAALEAAGEADLTDPAVAAGHLRGVALTMRGVLTRLGAEVVPVVTGRDAFDPVWHHCVGVVSAERSPFPHAPPHTVVRVVEDGYMLRNRKLTPAQVEIQAAPPTAPSPTATSTQESAWPFTK